jgi:hypothetical protein
MAIDITDSCERSLRVNAWNWGVLHHLVASANLLPSEVWEPARHGCGAGLDGPQVELLAEFLEAKVLPRLRPKERMFLDGTVTDVPDDGTFYREPNELWRNYSLQREVVESIVAFLRAANGPVTFS